MRSVLTYIFNEEPGGLTGFVGRFRTAALGDLVNSWVGSSAPRELTRGQVEGALGGSFIRQMADKAGLSVSQATPVLALLLPRLIGMLTADGKGPQCKLCWRAPGDTTGAMRGGGVPRDRQLSGDRAAAWLGSADGEGEAGVGVGGEAENGRDPCTKP